MMGYRRITFTFIDCIGRYLTYSDWGSKEPNSGTRENCLSLWHGHNFRWNDAPCSWADNYICEMKIRSP